MQRILGFLLCLFFGMSLVSCGGSDKLPSAAEEELKGYTQNHYCSSTVGDCVGPQITKVEKKNVGGQSSARWEEAWCVEFTVQSAGKEQVFGALMVKNRNSGTYEVIDSSASLTCKGVTIK